MSVELAQKTFKDIQDEYNHLYQTDKVRDEDRAYHWFAQKLMRLRPNIATVLDLACGGGYFIRELRKLSGALRLVGSDISDAAIEIAKKECSSAEYTLCVAENLPFASSTFDAITCLGSMEHFLDIPRAIAEMKRITKADGLFYILVPNIFWYKDLLSVLMTGNRKNRNQTQERFASQGEWIEVLQAAGLRVEKTIKYNGIAKSSIKQWFKDLLIPTRFSYHFLFICTKA